MKKILIISALEPWSMGKQVGAPSLFETLRAYGSSPDWDVTFLTTSKTKNVGGSHEENIDLGVEGVRVIREPQYMLPFVSGRVRAKLERLFGFTLSLKATVGKLLVQEQFDCVYCYEEAAISLFHHLSLKKYHRGVVVNRYQGTILGEQYKSILHCFRKYESYAALKKSADLFIMTNDGTCGDLALKYWNKDVDDDNLLFLRNGIDLNIGQHKVERNSILSSLGLDPNKKYSVTISRLAGWKRVDRAIQLMHSVAQAHPDVDLLICGDGESRIALEQMATELNIANRVHFLGAIGRDEVKNILHCADFFFSLYDVSNCGNPLFEAQLCGLPTITLDNGTTSDVISHEVNGLLLPPDRPDLLTQAFISLLEDEGKRQRISNNAFVWAAENLYSWEQRMSLEIEAIESKLS